jgi:mono/diheme cytochrome c family protein
MANLSLLAARSGRGTVAMNSFPQFISRYAFRMSGAIAVSFAAMLLLAAQAQAADEQLIKRGEYLARAGDCVSCHTAPGGKPYSGGLYMPTPFGEISTPNITPDKSTGIGDWSDDDFYRAMHEGIGRGSEYLYPVFPFPWFTKIRRDDVLAIKAYLFSLPAENAPRQPLRLAFPFSIRETLLAWRTAFFKPATFTAVPHDGDQVNRGAYLVEGLGHCGECHNRHAVFGASDWSGKLKGGEIEGWFAPNLTVAGNDSIEAWSNEQIVTFLKSGAASGKGVALGPMRETIDNSLRFLSDDDLGAIAAYIKTATSKESAEATAEKAQPATRAGGEIYLSSCAFCHDPEGKGVAGVIPALAGNPAVTAEGPENVIRVVLGGLKATHGLAPMPAIGVDMPDADIAAVVNYVRTSWGNAAPANAGAGSVADLRQKTRTLLAGNLANGCPGILDPRFSDAIGPLREKLKGTDLTNMLPVIESILPEARKSGASDDDIVNNLTAAYCPVVTADKAISSTARASLLGNFSGLVYGQLKDGGQPH